MEAIATTLGLNVPGLIWHAINFIVLLVLLRMVLYKPVVGMLDARAQRVRDSMDQVDAVLDTQNQQRLQARSIKRTELPQDVVGAAVFLCAAESDFITGQTLVVDGGAQKH